MQIYIDKYIMQLNIEYLTSLHAEIEQKQQSMCKIHFITIVSNGPKVQNQLNNHPSKNISLKREELTAGGKPSHHKLQDWNQAPRP